MDKELEKYLSADTIQGQDANERVERYAEAILRPNPGIGLLPTEVLRMADFVIAVADDEKMQLRIRGDQWKDAALTAEAKLAKVEDALDIRTRARAWMAYLGYEDHEIDKAEAWRQPPEPWLQDDPPQIVMDLSVASEFAREYEEVIRKAIVDA